MGTEAEGPVERQPFVKCRKQARDGHVRWGKGWALKQNKLNVMISREYQSGNTWEKDYWEKGEVAVAEVS